MDKQTISVLLVVAAISAIAALAIKGCSDKKVNVPAYFTEEQIDSVVANYEESTKVIDQLVSANNKLAFYNDSLKKKTEETSKKLELQAVKVKALSLESQLSREKIKDYEEAGQEFIDYVKATDALYPQIDSLVELADTYREGNRSLQNSNDSLLGNMGLRLARAEFDRDFYKEKFDTLSVYALALEKSKDKADKKAKKRFGFGPFLGGTYIDKWRGVVGGGVHYDLFKF